MKRVTYTQAALALLYFAERHPGQWHSYKQDQKTRKAVERAVYLGGIEVNEFKQFRLKVAEPTPSSEV